MSVVLDTRLNVHYGPLTSFLTCYPKPLQSSEIRMSFRLWSIVVLAIQLVACGGSDSTPNPNAPPGTTTSGCFAIVGNKGSITGTVSGLAAFNGIIADGGANRVTGGPVPTFT